MLPQINGTLRFPKRSVTLTTTVDSRHRRDAFITGPNSKRQLKSAPNPKTCIAPKAVARTACDGESNLPRIPLPMSLSASETQTSSRIVKTSIARQCDLQKKKQEIAKGSANETVVVVEVIQQLQPDSVESETVRRAKGEKTLDQVLRSLKPAFRHSRGSYTSTMSTNVSNMDQANQNASLPSGRDVGTSVEDDSVHVEDQEYDPAYLFKPTMEYVELPFSKEKTRVPHKKIFPVKQMPTDALAKHRREKREFAVGFQVPERADSIETLEDTQQLHQVALMRLCEAYTKNLGPKYLRAMARDSVQSPILSDDEDHLQLPQWNPGDKFCEDANKRLWNWDKSLINSKLLRDPQGRPIFNKDLGKGPYTDSPDPYQGSMGPNDYDAKSDLAALLIMDSEPSTDMEFDEKEFVEGNREHPFTDPIICAGGQHPSEARDRYLKHIKGEGFTTPTVGSTGSMISAIDSMVDFGDEIGGGEVKDLVEDHVPTTDDQTGSTKPDATIELTEFPEPLLDDVIVLNPLLSPHEIVSDQHQPNQGLSTEMTTTSVTTATTGTTGTTATAPSGRRSPSITTSTSTGTTKRRRGKKTGSASVGWDVRSMQAKYTMPNKKRRRRRKKKKKERRQRDPIELPNNLQLDNYQSGFEKVTIDWCKTIMASNAPNPMCWFEAMDAMEHQSTDAGSKASEEPSRDRDAYGLGKRFVAVAGGLKGLDAIIKQTAEPDQPKAEMLLDCMVKNYKLQMPLAVGDGVRLRELFIATIVKNPILYKMVLRRRNILPSDLQAFVAKIIEITESSDTMLASLYPSKSNTELILNAAKEMFASGYLAGGPPCPVAKPGVNRNTKKRMKSTIGEDTSELSDGETIKDLQNSESEEDRVSDQGASARIESYGSDLNHERAFNTSLYNPSRDILQEVAYHIPEFAYHVRPLFEMKWSKIGTDKAPEELMPQLCKLRNIRKKRLELIKLGFWFTDKEEREEALRVRRLSHSLVGRLCELLRGPLVGLPGSGVWMALLACLHGIMFWPPIGDFLICKLNTWIPALLLTLHSDFATVREEGCCVLSFLVTCYPLFSRLQYFCRHLLISNITFALLDAMERNPDTYASFHGTLGFLLHSIPCNAVVDCLLVWVPDILDRPTSTLAKDWPLFIYYIARQWPAFAMNWNLLYERQVLRLLEEGLKRRQCRHNARLAIGHYIRRRQLASTMITCWRHKDEEA